MIRYIPPFILQNTDENHYQGTLTAYVLLFDIADFTNISTVLQKEGKQGAEELSNFLDFAFNIPIEIVEKYGGFVTGFAGDAFCAIFTDTKSANIVSAVHSISNYIRENQICKTKLGEFNLHVRQTIGFGQVEWRIYQNDLQNEYVFGGHTIKEVAELSMQKADIIWTEPAAKSIGMEKFSPQGSGFILKAGQITDDTRLTEYHYKKDTDLKFCHSKYREVTIQNEIHTASFCFASLDKIAVNAQEDAVAELHRLLDKFGGFLNKLDDTDKGLVALMLFGLPYSEDKTLERICNFAMEAVEMLPDIALGISCGNVYAGRCGSSEINEYTALGYPLNVASRLMAKARVGEILTDTYLWQEMNSKYDFDYLGSLNMKGIDIPLRYYRLSRSSQDKSWHQENRFVGRKEEVASIRTLVSDSIQTKENSIIYVSGDAGIGKSRLVKEALAAFSTENCHVFKITCDAILQRPLEAVKQMIRDNFYYNPQLPVEAGIAMFRGLWIGLANNDIEMQRIESIIASFLNYEWKDSVWGKIQPENKPKQLMNAFIYFIERLTQIKPVLIYLDDAQWLDEESILYFQELSRSNIKPIIVISSCRYLDNGEKVDLGLSNYKRADLELCNLNDDGSIELIKIILRLENIPIETLNLIINQSMGNPLFLEQLTTYLMETGSLNDKGVIIKEIGHLSSFSISDIISSRIDRLTENVRICVFSASVLGMEFNVRVLSQMLKSEPFTELEIGVKNRIWKDLDKLTYIFSHILIKDIAYQRMISEKQEQLHKIAAEAMEIVFSEVQEENAEEIAYHFEKGNQLTKAAEYYNTSGCYFTDLYIFERAEKNFLKALQIREEAFGIMHPVCAISLNDLAEMEFHRGKYDQAEAYFLRALEIREKALGVDDIHTATSMNNLAGIYVYKGNYEKAESLHLKALEIREKILEPNDPNIVQSLNNLALLYYYQCKYDKAESLYLKAVNINDNIQDPDPSQTATALNNLAELYVSQCKYDLAEQLHERALQIKTREFGPEHPDIAISLNNLAILSVIGRKYDQAEKLFLRALEIIEKVLGPDHPENANTQNNLAEVYRQQGKYDLAESLILKSLELREKVLGPRHPDTAISLNNLAIVYFYRKMYDRAEPLFQRALEIREKVLGLDHPNTAQSLNNLARVYEAQGKFENVESLYLRALDINERYLGPDHLETAVTLDFLACLYSNQGKYEQAEPLFLKVLQIREKILGNNHPNTILEINTIIEFYNKKGEPGKASEYQARLDAED
jgi:tetratricopeptide (TPR) repeat protein/class 3 adenylate cyclase